MHNSDSSNTASSNYHSNSKVYCRPFLKWVGGKSQLIAELSNRLPLSFNNYFEPFLGGGALYFYLQPKQAFLSDINVELIDTYQTVRNQVEQLIKDLKCHIYDSEYYYNLRDQDRQPEYSKLTKVQRASRLIYLNKTGFNGLYRVNSKGQSNVPFGRHNNPKICDQDNLRACSGVLQQAHIQAVTFVTIADQANAGDFVYFDPPYIPINKTANFTSYSANGFDMKLQEELRDLCEDLDRKGVKFMLSNSDTELVRSLYANFNIEQVTATRMVNSKADKRGRVFELIVRNYL